MSAGTTTIYSCRNCCYELSGLDITGRCPECGEQYDRNDPDRFEVVLPPRLWDRLFVRLLAVVVPLTFVTYIVANMTGQYPILVAGHVLLTVTLAMVGLVVGSGAIR